MQDPERKWSGEDKEQKEDELRYVVDNVSFNLCHHTGKYQMTGKMWHDADMVLFNSLPLFPKS